jgi:Domain of unknown function (DUF397)
LSGWKKSSHSVTEATCLEVNTNWVKSTRSGNSGQCVEAQRPTADVVYVQDSKNPGVNILAFGAGPWTAFIEAVKDGEFDAR